MKTRILVAVVGIPLLLAVLLLLPVYATAILLAAMCTVAVYELLYRTSVIKQKAVVLVSCLMAIAVTAWSYAGCPQNFLLPGVICFVFILFSLMLRYHAQLRFETVCTAVFAGVLLPYLLCALVRIQLLEYNRFYILVPFVAAFSSDSGAYFVGCAIGKHKLAPVISPKKTVEGAIGGVLSGIVGMIAYCLVLQYGFGHSVNYLYGVIYGAVGAAVCVIGDLSFSVLKRQTGIKDYGTLLPGHGGILDRFDSMVLVAPVMEYLITGLPLIGG